MLACLKLPKDTLLWTASTWAVIEVIFVSNINVLLLRVKLPVACLSKGVRNIVTDIVHEVELVRSSSTHLSHNDNASYRTSMVGNRAVMRRKSAFHNMHTSFGFDTGNYLMLSRRVLKHFPDSFITRLSRRFQKITPIKVFGDLYSSKTQVIDTTNDVTRVIDIDNCGRVINSISVATRVD